MIFTIFIRVLLLTVIFLTVSAQMDMFPSISQRSAYSAQPGTSFIQDEGLTPATGHYNPRNIQMSKSSDDEFIISIPNSMADSGQVRTDGIANTYANAGSALRADSAAFLSFDISRIPKEANIKDVTLKFEGFDIVGEPFTYLGCLNIYPASYRMLAAAKSYSMASTMPYLKICSQSELYSPLNSPYLTTAVRASLGIDKLQFRLQFDREGANMQEGSAVTTYIISGDTESTGYGGSEGLIKIYSSDDYADDYLSTTPAYDEEMEYYMGFDRSFLQSDFGDYGEAHNSRYIVLAPNTNLSQLGITQEMIDKAIDPNRVSVSSGYIYEKASVIDPAIDSVIDPIIGPDDYFNVIAGSEDLVPDRTVKLDPKETGRQFETSGSPRLIVRKTESFSQEAPRSSHLIKSGVVWLTIIYSMPELKPNLGGATFKLPEPRYLINLKGDVCGAVPANQLLVMVNSRLGFKEAEILASRLAADLNGEVVGKFQYLNLFQIETQSLTRDELIRDMIYARNYNSIDLAFPNYQLCHESRSPLDDEIYQGESGKDYRIIGLQESWDLIKYSKIPISEVHVGVTDDGIYKGYGEFHKPDINTSMKICPEAPPSLLEAPLPEYEIAGSHGTGIMNMLVADDDDGGIVGIISPAMSVDKKIKFDMINIYVEDKAFITTSLLGLKAEIENGCTILSCSWGNSYADEQATAMYERFFGNLSRDYPKLLFIFSAGNEGIEVDGNIRIPNGLPNGPLPNLITVGNIMNDGQICESSNRNKDNEFVTLAAPGEQAVWGRDNLGRTINEWGGTSMATPQVSAAATLVRSINPGLNAGEIKNILIETGRQDIDGIRILNELGGRVIAIDNAVKKAIDDRPNEVEISTKTRTNIELPEGSDSNINIIGSPDTSYDESSGFDAKVTIKSVQYKGYDVKVDGKLIGTEGTGQDSLDGSYAFKISGNTRHVIRVDHPLNWKRWLGFFKGGDNYNYEF
jgi:hypothetical protein